MADPEQISIHAPLAGRDLLRDVHVGGKLYFNPRAPCGARPPQTRATRCAASFQSTRPLRGATWPSTAIRNPWCHFNPRAPCGARPTPGRCLYGPGGISIHAPLAGRDWKYVCQDEQHNAISIHAPLAGRDVCKLTKNYRGWVFQSTRPLRGATIMKDAPIVILDISIHAPLAGRDVDEKKIALNPAYISIHAPLAGRDRNENHHHHNSHRISIHAPLAGRDRNGQSRQHRDNINFNPRAPCGARPPTYAPMTAQTGISIHAPLAGRDGRLHAAQSTRQHISIHAPLAGRDSKSAQKNAALLRKRYKYKLFVCKKCTSGDLTGAYSSKNTLYSGANCSENPCALSVRTHRISGPSTSNPGLMPKCSILERYFSPR